MKVVAVISGGMDSAVMLYQLVREGHEVRALSVDYGQRHRRELESAAALCQAVGIGHAIADLSGLVSLLRGSSQTDASVPVPHGHYEDASMRLTVVPNRNMLLLATAAAHAVSMGFEAVAYGAHAGDHAIYPDCRPAFVDAMTVALGLCDYRAIRLLAPFLDSTKTTIAALGATLGVPFELTWTCYEGGLTHCGLCGACTERREAFALAGLVDPVAYA